MDNLIRTWLFHNWKLKFFALLTASVLWLFVNHSITATKTVVGIPVRIINVPEGKAIEGLLSNGMLNRKLNLTLSGSRESIEHIEPSDLEVVLDAADAPDEWIVQIAKKNLVSLTPDIDISRDIHQVTHQEIIIDMDKLITAKIPVRIRRPTGKPPHGYELMNIWPKILMHQVSGPRAVVQQLHAKGLELTFDISEISKDDLDSLQSLQSGFYSDEVSYKVPDIWKKVTLPVLNRPFQAINDPHADNLRIDFLRKEFIAIERKIPIRVFYPLKNSSTINPETYPLEVSGPIEEENGVPVLTIPTLGYEVSRLFMDIVRDHMEVVITADPDPETGLLPWSVEFVDPQALEDRFVSFLYTRHNLNAHQNEEIVKMREDQWRYRFRNFMIKMTLYQSPNRKLILNNKLSRNHVVVETH